MKFTEGMKVHSPTHGIGKIKRVDGTEVFIEFDSGRTWFVFIEKDCLVDYDYNENVEVIPKKKPKNLSWEEFISK